MSEQAYIAFGLAGLEYMNTINIQIRSVSVVKIPLCTGNVMGHRTTFSLLQGLKKVSSALPPLTLFWNQLSLHYFYTFINIQTPNTKVHLVKIDTSPTCSSYQAWKKAIWFENQFFSIVKRRLNLFIKCLSLFYI